MKIYRWLGMHVAAWLCLLSGGLSGQVTSETASAVVLDGWSYSTTSRPLSERYADSGGRLSDGEHGRDKTVILRGGTVEITLQLAAPERVTAVRVHQHRHNLNYRLTYLAVLCRTAGHWEERGRLSEGFVGPTASMDFVHTIPLRPTETDSLRLRFVGANVLSVSEIEVLGVVSRPVQGGSRPFAAIPFQPLNAPAVHTEDLDGDGTPEVILENRFVRLIFTPAHGGICQSFRWKATGAELVGTERADHGLFRDQLWKPNYSFADRVYFHDVRQVGDQASVELWTTGSGGMMSFTEIRKTVSLTRDSPIVEVHYRLTNQPSSQTEYEYGLWFHNWLGDPDSAHNTYVFPTTEGVSTFTLAPADSERGGDTWYRHPARGWTAVYSAAGTGLGIQIPYTYLNLFYHWHGSGSRTATHEWRFNLLTCNPGDTIEADLRIVPFQNMPRVDGVVAGVVGALLRQDARVTARLNVADGSQVKEAELRLLSIDRKTTLATSSTDLSPGSIQECTATTGDAQAFIAHVTLRNGKHLFGTFERCFGGTAVLSDYALKPEAPQEGRREDTGPERQEYCLRTDVVTPHIAWANPLPDGPIRALVLMDDMNCREAVELAQRVDMELDYVKFRTTLAKELIWQGDRSIETLAQAQARLADRLRNRPYDVLIAAGFDWRHHFTDEIRRLVVQNVREGMGLFLIQPDGFDLADAEELPVAGVAKADDAARPMHAWHRWRAEQDHPLTAGLDWSRYPLTRRHEYDVPPAGTVIATIGDDHAPLVVVDQLGAGRVVSVTWDTLTHAMSYRGYSALTPILSYRGGWLRSEFSDLPAGYHEWWYALICRLTLWAAGRGSGVDLLDAPAVTGRVGTRPDVALTLNCRTALRKARIDLYWYDAIGELQQVTMDAGPLKPGKNTLTVSPPANSLTQGDNTLCLVVRDPQNAAVASGFTTVTLNGPPGRLQLTLSPDTLLPGGGIWQQDTAVQTQAFLPSDPLTITASLSEKAAQPLQAHIRIRDSRSRLLARMQGSFPAGGDSLTVTWQPAVLVHQGIEVELSLLRGDVLIDRAVARTVAYRPRVWERFWFTSWGGQYLWRSHYLFDFNNRLVRDFGIDVSFWGSNELNTGKVRDNAFWGINHSWLGLLSYLGKGVPDFMDRQFGKKATAYAKTRDHTHLVRTPSLVDPEWRASVKENLLNRTTATIEAGGTYDYCMGDEMSLTHYTAFHDYDWSEHSLADFRRWLQKRYADLDALNAAWSTHFGTWDDILPMTRDEAREAANPAPWCEFRMYMNHQLADFYRFVRDTIRSVDPHARCSLSGTQSPEAANGMDWWLLSDAFTYYHSYNTSWSNEMRRSFQHFGRPARQSPYFSGYSAVDPACQRRMWWCLFHDTRGISCWKTGLFFYGDFTRTQSGIDTARHLDEFNHGIWRLIRGARRRHDRIAIHVSMPTIISAALTGESKAVNAYRDAWVKLVEDSGLQYEFVSHEQIRRGLLDDGEFRLLILPHALALARDEAAAIRRFVRRDGHVMTTLQPGRRDALGRPRKPGLLDDLFGIKSEGAPRAVDPGLTFKDEIAAQDTQQPVRLLPAMTTLVTDGADAMGSADEGTIPVVIRGEEGRTVLLNIDLMHVEQERRFHSPAEKALRNIVRTELARAGIQPRYPISLASGRCPHVETVLYEAEGIVFLCLLNWDDDRDVADIRFPRAWHVYDVRAGADLGQMDTLRIPLEPGAARVFALCRRPMPAPALEADRTVRRGTPLGLTVALPGPAADTAPLKQLVRIDVVDADGNEREEYRQTMWLAESPVTAVIPIALNDPEGEWRITAYDVISGAESSRHVSVR